MTKKDLLQHAKAWEMASAAFLRRPGPTRVEADSNRRWADAYGVISQAYRTLADEEKA